MDSIIEWAASATPGDQLEYGRGYLASARHERTVAIDADDPVPPEVERFCNAADDAWHLYLADQVALVQRRHGKFDYSYIAVRARH